MHKLYQKKPKTKTKTKKKTHTYNICDMENNPAASN